MTTLVRRLRLIVEPAIAAIALALWSAGNANAFVTEIPIRSDYALTNPYHVAIAVALALSIATVRVVPRFSVGIVGGVLVTQTVAWPSRFSNENWTAYAMLVLLAFGLSIHASAALRRVSIVVALPIAALVSALLNVPAMSTTGMWGLINGKPPESTDVPTGFAISALVLIASFSFAWYLGYLWRSRLAQATSTSEQFDGAAGQSLSSHRNPAGLTELTPREREVYFLIAEGLATNEIAAAAHIEESTVKSHISSVLSKLGLSSRTAIVAHAYRNGFLVPVPVD
jgi:DNA-binding CsgD family transcriptional regulator